MDIEWRPVVGWEGLYKVSNEAQVRRVKATGKTYAGRILTQRVQCGRLVVKLSDAKGKRHGKGDGRYRFVHRLVAATFIGPCPPGKEVNHKDYDKFNNRADNLEYVTHSENMKHSYAHGHRVVRGSTHKRSTINEDQARAIKELHRQGLSKKAIVQQTGIKYMTVWHVVNGTAWRHVN